MIDRKFYKQTMASGKEYYLAEVIEKYKVFFGLITFSDKYNVMLCSNKEYHLHQFDSYNNQFKTLEEAELATEEALERKKQDTLNATLLTYNLIKTT